MKKEWAHNFMLNNGLNFLLNSLEFMTVKMAQPSEQTYRVEKECLIQLLRLLKAIFIASFQANEHNNLSLKLEETSFQKSFSGTQEEEKTAEVQ